MYSNRNLTARIMNPLAGISPDQLSRNVDQFVQEKGLSQHRDDFIKGAFLAQSPKEFESLPQLDETDKEVM